MATPMFSCWHQPSSLSSRPAQPAAEAAIAATSSSDGWESLSQFFVDAFRAASLIHFVFDCGVESAFTETRDDSCQESFLRQPSPLAYSSQGTTESRRGGCAFTKDSSSSSSRDNDLGTVATSSVSSSAMSRYQRRRPLAVAVEWDPQGHEDVDGGRKVVIVPCSLERSWSSSYSSKPNFSLVPSSSGSLEANHNFYRVPSFATAATTTTATSTATTNTNTNNTHQRHRRDRHHYEGKRSRSHSQTGTTWLSDVVSCRSSQHRDKPKRLRHTKRIEQQQLFYSESCDTYITLRVPPPPPLPSIQWETITSNNYYHHARLSE